jgi:ribosome-binding ATPase
MALKIGIVGLPNVGKSTLFNALTKQAAESANFPFTTIEPNIGVVPVPDERLDKLTELSKSAKTTPTAIEFVDIAGLVKNAHAGEGLGNKFLSHIREVEAIIHVVRFFDDPNVTHVSNKVDPISDAATIETELALADLDTIERLLKKAEEDVKRQEKQAPLKFAGLTRLKEHLAQGGQARQVNLSEQEQEALGPIPLLTSKPILYVANVSESQITTAASIIANFAIEYSPVLPLSVKIEQELVGLDDEERVTFLKEYGLTETGLNRLIKAGYDLLGLITFLTTGPTESRAWTITKGSTAPQAAGKIHTDMERGFIRAETVAYNDLITTGSYASARAAGKVRDEGKEYVVQDGDIMLFKFSV